MAKHRIVRKRICIVTSRRSEGAERRPSRRTSSITAESSRHGSAPRRDAAAEILNPAISEGLAVLPDWQRLPRDFIHEEEWLKQLAAAVRYRATGHGWPLSTAAIPGEEYELGVRLRHQRFQLRNGKLSSGRAEALDASLPGWLAGRKGVPLPARRRRWRRTLTGQGGGGGISPDPLRTSSQGTM